MQLRSWSSNGSVRAVILISAVLLTTWLLIDYANGAVDKVRFQSKHRALLAGTRSNKTSFKSDDDNDHGRASSTGDDEKPANNDGQMSSKDFTESSGGDEDRASKSKVEHKIYDATGWHFPPDGFVTKVMGPEELQPFYIMPIVFAVKLILTMSIFGFGLKFKETRPSCFDIPSRIAKALAGLSFIAMALNGYYQDYLALQADGKHVNSFGKRVAVFFVLWATSSNYVACRAVWNSLAVENPAVLLSLKPKYAACVLGVPLVPGGAKWLDPLRHIYALILLPYFAPFLAFQLGLSFALCCWCCSTKCAVALGLCTGSFNCSCALVGTIVTLGYWLWAKNALGYWWGLEQPIYYFLAVQFWASIIAPMVFTLIYGCVNCFSMGNISKGMFRAQLVSQGGVPIAAAGDDLMMQKTETMAIDNSLIEKADQLKLCRLNEELLFEDFEYLPVNPEENGDDSVDLDDAKVSIFSTTLTKMSSIVTEQMSLIFMIRVLNTADSYEECVGALVKTMTERTWLTYSHSLMSVASAARSKALNTVWILL